MDLCDTAMAGCMLMRFEPFGQPQVLITSFDFSGKCDETNAWKIITFSGLLPGHLPWNFRPVCSSSLGSGQRSRAITIELF